MNVASPQDVRKLLRDPLSFAMLMDDGEIEEVIDAFVSVLNKRRPDGGG